MHLRFGTVSIRTLARLAYEISLQPDGKGAATLLSGLIWWNFYFMVLAHHPRLAKSAPFKPEYEQLHWEKGRSADAAFAAWCDGRTGYPLVDAAMLQLNQTGYMHNRLRMVTASFLAKDLGIDWRLGERYFADLLNDFDFSANNGDGGWQWAASTGYGAQTYVQSGHAIRKIRPRRALDQTISTAARELAGKMDSRAVAGRRGAARGIRCMVLGGNYPERIVDQAQARERTLARYGK
ncbi:deoxyribodipyrimidine photolyase [Paraburkholderia sp. 40]